MERDRIELRLLGGDLDRAEGEGLTVLEADELLSGMMRRRRSDRTLFHQTLGAAVRHLTKGARVGLRISDEMVELLTQDGDSAAAGTSSVYGLVGRIAK